jgi:histone acetyltransferase (RNA polymerase elongator complex component)
MRILPIFIPHLGCPFDCIYCNQKLITKTTNPDLNLIKQQISDFCNSTAEKGEIAFFGGTFTALPRQEQQKYFDLVSPYLSKLSGIRISTRPDFISQNELQFCKENGVTTIELGVQSFSNDVLKDSSRGYTSKTVMDSCRLIKSNSFQLGIQLMPGLPGFSRNSLKTSIEKTIEMKPDFVRIYPTVILKGTALHQMNLDGSYTPLTMDDAIEISAEMKQIFEQNNIKVIKIGLHSDIEFNNIVDGPYHESFGELVKAEIHLRLIVKKYVNKTLRISRDDISLFKGHNNLMLNKLKGLVGIEQLPVKLDSTLKQGFFLFTDSKPDNYW